MGVKGVDMVIYTITLNPSIDYFIEVDGEWMETEVNRAKGEKCKAGGKGLNVSMVLNEMHIPSTAIALLGGFSGAYIRDYLKDKKHITLKEIPVDGANRINVKIQNHDKTICINGNGPMANEQTKDLLRCFLDQVNEHDWVMINGSYARQLDHSFIVELAVQISQHGARLIMDTEGLDMELIRQCKPYLIKPNRYEFSLLIKEAVAMERIMDQAKALLDQGVEYILLSLGADGALCISQKECYRLCHEALAPVNLVGSGDAMLAAFVAHLSLGDSISEALRWGGAGGMAAVTTLEDVKADMMECFLNRCSVERIR